MPAEPATLDPHALWRNPDYRRYSGSWFLITFSRRVEFVAIGAHLAAMYGISWSPFLFAIMGLVQALPVILLAIPGGHLADRYSRRNIMLLMFSLGVVSAIGLLAVALLQGPVWHLYLLLGIGAVGWALGGPSRQALLPQLVPTELFSNAVAWNSSVFYIASVTGPAVGGAIVWASGHLESWGSQAQASLGGTLGPVVSGLCRWMSQADGLVAAFALVLLCRVIAIVAICFIHTKPPVKTETSLSWESVVAGIRFVWSTKLILAAVTLDLFAVLLGGVTYLLPIYAQDILRVDALGLGCLQSADAIGAICMAMLLAHRPPLRRAGPTLFWAVAGFGGATILFGLSHWFWLSLLAMFLIGALDNISVVVRHTLVQMLTPDEMRGRVSAVNGVFITASNDLGGLESGLTAGLFGRMFGPALGPVISVVGGGIGTILVVLTIARIWPQLFKIGSLAAIRPESLDEPERQEL